MTDKYFSAFSSSKEPKRWKAFLISWVCICIAAKGFLISWATPAAMVVMLARLSLLLSLVSFLISSEISLMIISIYWLLDV